MVKGWKVARKKSDEIGRKQGSKVTSDNGEKRQGREVTRMEMDKVGK